MKLFASTCCSRIIDQVDGLEAVVALLGRRVIAALGKYHYSGKAKMILQQIQSLLWYLTYKLVNGILETE